jgi:hypothetical protein
MRDLLKEAMEAIEAAADVPAALTRDQHWAALAGLGSKFLAIGAPQTIGLSKCGDAASPIYACHDMLFGPLEIRSAGEQQFESGLAPQACSTEESLACDVVCLTTSEDFLLEWIADATHLNIVDSGSWSSGMQALATRSSVTWVGKPRHELGQGHGSLAQVIQGKVSGRVSDEITCLLWTPDESAA